MHRQHASDRLRLFHIHRFSLDDTVDGVYEIVLRYRLPVPAQFVIPVVDGAAIPDFADGIQHHNFRRNSNGVFFFQIAGFIPFQWKFHLVVFLKNPDLLFFCISRYNTPDLSIFYKPGIYAVQGPDIVLAYRTVRAQEDQYLEQRRGR